MVNEILFKEINPNLFIFGQINEKTCLEFIGELWALCAEILATPKTPLELSVTINSDGGEISSMNAICDAIEFIKNSGFTVHTIGLGSVMSAALLILGSGTKGYRKIGKNTRLMFHPIISEHGGTYNTIRTEYEETKYCQEQYLEKLCELTGKNKEYFEAILAKDMNYYFRAEEAISWGLTDILFNACELPLTKTRAPKKTRTPAIKQKKPKAKKAKPE